MFKIFTCVVERNRPTKLFKKFLEILQYRVNKTGYLSPALSILCVLPPALRSSKCHVPRNVCDFNCLLAKCFAGINSGSVASNHEFCKRPCFRESRRFLGTGWTAQESRSLSCWGRRFTTSPKASSPVLGVHTASYPTDIWKFFPGETVQSTSSTAEFKNSWSDTFRTL